MEETEVDSLASVGIHSFEWAQRFLDDFRVASVEIPEAGQRTRLVRWRLPRAGSCKLNIDAAVMEDSRKWTVGAVIRDHQGIFFVGLRPQVMQGMYRSWRRKRRLCSVAYGWL